MTKKYLHVLDDARRKLLKGVGPAPGGDFVADEFQRDAISSVTGGVDTLVVAPTGAGKTFIALEAIRATLALKGRAVYTTPLKALSNTKYAEFKRLFEPAHAVGLLTGDRKIDGDSQFVVATTEIYRNELYNYDERYSLVVLDEVHFISDPQRGPVWEESIILTPLSSTLLMLSASVSNAAEVAEWISGVRGRECRIVMKTERPVELRFGFLHPEYGVLPLFDERGDVFPEVREFYGSAGLDHSGTRLSGGDFQRPRRGGRPFRRRSGRR